MATIHLQGIGEREAIPAKEIIPGTKIIWNYGHTSLVKSIEFSKTGKTVTIVTESNGRTYSRRHSSESLFAVEKPDPRLDLYRARRDFIQRQCCAAPLIGHAHY